MATSIEYESISSSKVYKLSVTAFSIRIWSRVSLLETFSKFMLIFLESKIGIE